MQKLNTREIGNSLEEWLVAYLEEIDPKTKQSNNSGAVSNDGDINCSLLRVEGKHRNTENLTLQRKVWNKLCSSLNIYDRKIPVLMMRNKYNEVFVVLSFQDFKNMYKEYFINEKSRKL